jgi:uncharacterized protein (PEP-CTERM system associated)
MSRRKSDVDSLSFQCRRPVRGGRRAGLTLVALVVVGWGGGVHAQDVAPARAISFEPSVSASQLLTDNVRLTPAKSHEAITQLSAALRLSSRTGRVQGTLDYALNGYVYARDSGANTAQNTLNAAVRADVIENWLTVDGRATIGQQAVSAFGVQSVDPLLGRKNLARIRSYDIAPAVHGRALGDLEYQARLSRGATRSSEADSQGDATTTSATASLGSARNNRFNWNVGLSRQKVDYVAGRTTDSDTASLTLGYVPSADWRASVNAGRESNNYRTQDKTATSRWGVGAEWTPSASTRVAGQWDHRFFGNGYQLSLDYRLPRSVIRLSSARDISDPLQQASTINLGTAYDLIYAQFASVEPDPVRRDLLVRSYLQSYAIDPARIVSAGFLTNEATLSQRTELSYAMQGVRDTLIISVMSNSSSRLSRLAAGTGDFANSDVVRQRVYTLSLGHKLTPNTGINLDLQDQTTAGSSTSQASTLRAIRLNLSTALGPRSTASLAARHVVFDSTVQPYTENALIATFGLRF